MKPTSTRTTLRDKGQVTVPANVRAALHVDVGDDLEFEVDEATGTVTVRGLKTIRADQAWFWNSEWQAKEAEATADIAAGRSTQYDDAASFLDSLT